MKNRNWFWGIFFLLSAVFVIACQTGAFGQIGVLSILATVLLATLLIHSIIHLNFFGVFIPVALFYMIYRQPLGLVEISPWLLLMSAVFASIGFSFLFHSHSCIKMHHHSEMDHFNQTTESTDDNNPFAKVSFGASSKYLHGDCLKSGQFSVSFGALELFFDEAKLSPDGAEIFLDCSFGAIKLYIPKGWRVIDNMQASLGGVDNNTRLSHPDENAPRLTVSGNVQLGAVEIHYV